MNASDIEKSIRGFTDQELRELRMTGYRTLRQAQFEGRELPFCDVRTLRAGLDVVGREMGRRGL